MIAEILMVAALAAPQTPSWTWTLYDSSGPVVLANERPDTPDLRSTLECNPGSGLARVSVYSSDLVSGFASITSGDASATVEATASGDGAIVAPLRTDHPVFARFTATGNLALAVGEHRQTIEIGTADLAKLRRFADLCSG
jgi:hypothetical protein